MLHVVWKGSISFGLVNVPVVLHTAEVRNELDFTMLDRRDHSPIGYRKVNKTTGEEVKREDIVKGYKLNGDYVLVTDEELKRANPEKTKRIDILGFVELADIDPKYFDRPYYLEPSPKNEKPYALLREALERSGRAGIAEVVIGTREYLAAMFPRGRALILNLLRYSNELKSPEDLNLPDKNTKVSAKEIDMAGRLIGEMAMKWKPEEFHDDYRDDVLEMIRKKAKTGVVPVEEVPKPKKKEEVLDMMALLKKSLEQKGKKAPVKRKRAS